MSIINIGVPGTGSFLVDIILGLVTATSSVAAGVVLFTLILKLITLPFDFISRSSMRKNSIKMEEMRPELEKLQKQYADNKDLYNQKIMALYKKNGYSMFGSCLPTILTLVIFIVAINAFNDYSRYQNHKYFYDMSLSYNSVIYEGMDLDDKYIYIENSADGEKLVIKTDDIKADAADKDGKKAISVNKEDGTFSHEIFVDGDLIYTTNSYVGYNVTESKYVPIAEKFVSSNPLATDKNDKLTVVRDGKNISYADFAATYADAELTSEIIPEGKTKEEYLPEYFLKDIRQQKAADTFNNNGSSFLWVKNIWVTDSATAHPVESFSDFNNKHGKREGGSCSCNNTVIPVIALEDDYNNLTAKLEDKKTQPNGYYIFVILTAGISLLTQLVMSKGQKAQMELQTVDGQGAQTQKIMMWMMPIMMAIFAFMYTAAFSIYIVLSSLISMCSTIVINKIVDKKHKNKEEDGEVIRSKNVIHKAEEERKAAEEKKNAPKKKNKEPETGDFLSGEADKKKHVRGRLK